MQRTRLSILGLIVAILVCCTCIATAEDAIRLSRTAVEQTTYVSSDRDLNGQDLSEGYIQLIGYSEAAGNNQWTLTQTSGPEDILRIEGNRTTGSGVWIEFAKSVPAAGNYTYTLTCAWQGVTYEAQYTLHIIEIEPLRGITRRDAIYMHVGDVVEDEVVLNPVDWSIPEASEYCSAYVYDNTGSSWYYGSTSNVRVQQVGNRKLSYTAYTPGFYRIKLSYSCTGYSAEQERYVIVYNEDNTEPEYNFPLNCSDYNATYYVNSSAYIMNSLLATVSTSSYTRGSDDVPEWVMKQVAGPEDVLTLTFSEYSSYTDYTNGYVRFSKNDLALGDYEYLLTCTRLGVTKSTTLTFSIAEPPHGRLMGIVKPDMLYVPLNGEASLTLELNPDGWELPGVTPSWTANVQRNGTYIYNSDTSPITVQNVDNVYTFAGREPGYYLITYYYSCGTFSANTNQYVVVLNEDGSTPDWDFHFNGDDIEQTVYLNSKSYYRGSSVPNGYVSLSSSYYPDGYHPTWTLEQVSGDSDILYITDTQNSYMYVYYSVDRPPVGDYVYDLSCELMGTVRTRRMTIHVVNPPLGDLEGISVPSRIIVPYGETVDVTTTLNPAGWYLPDTTANMYGYVYSKSGSSYYNGDSSMATIQYRDGVLKVTGYTPGIYSVRLNYNNDNFSASTNARIVVLNEDGSEPEWDYSVSASSNNTTFYLKNNTSYKGNSFGYFSIPGYIKEEESIPTWTLTWLSGPQDAIEFVNTTDYSGDTYPESGSFVWTVNRPEVGDYEYELSCTWMGTVRTAQYAFSVAEPPMGDLQGIISPGLLEVPLNGTAQCSPSLDPEGWYLPDVIGNWYCYIYKPNGSGTYNGDQNSATAQVHDGKFTFTGYVPGYYRVHYNYNCNPYSASVYSTIVVLNADGTRPAYDFSLTDNVETRMYLAEWQDYSGVSFNGNYTAISGVVPDGEEITWKLTKVSGFEDILSFNDRYSSSTSRNLIFSKSNLQPGTYVYDVSATLMETTKTRRITLILAEPPYGALEGMVKPETLTMRPGETKSVTVTLQPANWSIPGETEDWYCYVYQEGFSYYNGTQDSLHVEAADGIYTFTAVKPGYYQVNYQYSCANFYASAQSFVIVLNEDGSEPEYTYSVRVTSDITMYRASANMINRDVSDGYFSIQNYQDQPGKDVQWSLSYVSGPEDAIGLRTYNYVDSASYDGYLRWKVDEPAIGDYEYELICNWMGTEKRMPVTVHLLESPMGYLEDIAVENTYTVGLNETLVITPELVPANWSLPGETGFWNCSVYVDDSWIEPSDNTYCRVVSTGQGYEITGLTSGYYRVYFGYHCANANVGKEVTVVVLNADGSRPERKLRLNSENKEISFYLSTSQNTHSYVNDGYTYLMNYTYNGEALPVWNFYFESGPSDAFYIHLYDNNRSVDVYASSTDLSVGDYVYTLTCSYEDASASVPYTIHVQRLSPQLNGISGETTIRVQPRSKAEYTYVIDPSDFSDYYPDGEWSAYFNDPESGYSVSDNVVQRSVRDGVLSVTGYVPGVYRGQVSYHIKNVYQDLSVKLIVLNEDGSEPDDVLAMSTDLYYDPLMIDPDNYSYIGSQIAYANLRYATEAELQENRPVWSLRTPEGQEGMYRLEHYYYLDRGIGVYFMQEPQTEGEYTFTVVCEWNGSTAEKTFTYSVLRANAPDEVVYENDSAYIMNAGETLTLMKPYVLPTDWNVNGTKPEVSLDWYQYPSWNRTGLTIKEDSADRYVFRADMAGTYRINMNLECGSYRYYYQTIVLVADKNTSISLPVQGGNDRGENDPVYLRDGWSYLTSLSISNMQVYEKVFEGEPVLTLQADRSDVTFALESYGSGDYWERGIYLDEHPMESFDMTVTWTITWGEVTQTGSFQVCARIPENGIPEGISIMPSGTITAKAGEPFTMTVSMIPEGWTMDGVEPVIYIDGEADSVETNGLAATVMYNEPGWYVLDVQAGAKSYFFWQDVLIKVTDAKGNVPEAPDMVLNIDMADSYVVGEVVPLSSQLMNNVGWSNWIDTLTKDGQPYAYEGVWDSDLEVDGFVATETGTYTYSISVEDLLGRKISESHTFKVVEGTPLTFGGVSVATGDGSLDISVRLSGGMSTPSTRVDLYRGLSNNVRVGTVTGKGTSYLFDQLIDGLYQAVVHTTDGTSSFAQATGFYEVKNGKVTALTGTLTLPKALREIDEEAFYGTAAATVIVPSGTTTIGAHAFQNSYVTRITIPASVTSIADNAFEGASRYITVVTPAGSKAETWAKNHGYLVEN